MMISSRIWAMLHPATSCSHVASETVAVSWSSSTSLISTCSRSDHNTLSTVPLIVSSSCASALQEAGIVQQHEDASYTLTREGANLLRALAPLNDWALDWVERERLRNDRNEMS